MLKALYASLEDVPEQYRELFEKTDDGYVFTGLDDSDFKTKLKEFRDSNSGLHQKNRELLENLEKVKDIDLDEYQKMMELKKKFDENEEMKLLSEGKWEEVLERRTEGMKSNFESQTAALTKAAEDKDELLRKVSTELNTIKIERDLTNALNEKDMPKPREGAMDDIVTRTHRVFSYNEKGERQALGSDGKPRYGKEGKEFTMAEHVHELAEVAPHLFHRGKGGGASGSEDLPPGQSIERGDGPGFIKNLDKIAKGEVGVRP